MRNFFIGWIAACAAILILYLLAGPVDAQQIMRQDVLDSVRASLPIIEDEDVNSRLHGDDLVWYTSNEIKPAYQKQVTGRLVGNNGYGNATFHDPNYNISADPSDQGKFRHGNAAHEFPWTVGKAGGTHTSPGVKSVKAFYFPKPAAVFRRVVSGRVGTPNQTLIWDWVFSEGTEFYEVLYQSLRGEHLVYEVRLRRKVDDGWEFDVFRPFSSAEDLADVLESLGPGDWREPAIKDLRSDKDLPRDRLYDAKHRTKFAFDVTTEVYEMPPLDGDDVQLLLDRPFVSCLGVPFKGEAYAPSNYSKYANIVPPNYHGAFINHTGTSDDCMNCHSSACLHSTTFDRFRGWYGRTPGGYTEKINSWHPMENASVAWGGFAVEPVLRRSFVENGLVVFVRDRLPEGYKFTKVD